MAQQVRRRFTAEEFHLMADAGVFGDGDRVELLEGEVVEMSPIGSRHAACVRRLAQFFAEQVTGRALVDIQNPIRLDEWSEPQPDLALLRPRPDYYAAGHPRPDDVLLVVEVADTSATADRVYKLPLYAAAGVAEVWLVDLAAATLEVCTSPAPTGYGVVRRALAGDHVAPAAFPDASLAVADLLT
jgi:Uma2 family endonuclease